MKYSPHTTTIDAKVLQVFRASAGEDASAFLAELIDCYLEETPKQLQAMEVAVAQGNTNALQQEAHTLKSNSAALGAITLSKLCKELEVLTDETIESPFKKLLQIEAEYEKVKAALRVEKQQSQI